MFLWHFFAGIARAILPQSFIKKLRGDRSSVFARFVSDPIERINLFFYRLKGGSYLTWYARRMDRFAIRRRDEDPAEHEAYFDTGIQDTEVIKKVGVKPHHSLHEFGCGFLRSARFFIEYLDKGNFSANDTSGERIKFGVDRWRAQGLNLVDEKAPTFIASTDNSFDWMDGRTVDYIWCHAVFGHMPPGDVAYTIGRMKNVLTPGGAIIFTYGENPFNDAQVIRTSVKDWYHSLQFFSDIAKMEGLEIVECDDDINKTYPDDDVLIMRPA